MFWRNGKALTQRLSGSAYSLTAPGGKRGLKYFLIALCLGLGILAWVLVMAKPPMMQTQAEIDRLQQEVTKLQHEVQLGELRLQQEMATRQELASQMDQQSQKLRAAEQELEFFRAQKGSAPRGAPVHK